MGNYLKSGAILGVILVLAFAGPAMAQSISVDLDRNTAGVQSTLTAAAGETVQGAIVLNGIAAYRGHTLRVQVAQPAKLDGAITYSDGVLAGANNRTVTSGGVTFMSSVLLQTIPTDITVFPAVMLNFDFKLAADFDGELDLHIIYVGDTTVPANLTANLAVVTPEGSTVLSPANFTLVDGKVSSGAPVDTPTPTPTEPEPTPTPTIPEPTPTPTVPTVEAGFIVMDGFGGFHSLGTAPNVVGNESYYPGFDIVKDFEILPDGSAVVVVDGYGANDVFALAGSAVPSIDRSILPPYVPGLDIYRAVKAKSDSLGYWILDAQGKIYAVGSALPEGATESLVAAVEPPLPVVPVPIWGIQAGVPSAVDFAPVNDGEGVIVVDSFGGTEIIGDASSIGVTAETLRPYFGWDIARAIKLEPNGLGYMLLDGYGAIHPVGPARTGYEVFLPDHNFYFGWDVAEKLAYTPDGTGMVVLDAFGGRHYLGSLLPLRTGAGADFLALYFGFDVARDIEIYVAPLAPIEVSE